MPCRVSACVRKVSGLGVLLLHWYTYFSGGTLIVLCVWGGEGSVNSLLSTPNPLNYRLALPLIALLPH